MEYATDGIRINAICPGFIEKNAVTLWRLGYESLLSYLKPIQNKSILDYGCGSETFCRLLIEKKAIVSGVDISENMIKSTKKVYICGPQPMMDAIEIQLSNLRIDKKHIIKEAF